MKWNAVVVCIVKNEGEYIEDWLCYYISIGVSHFLIYDNGSTDDTQRRLTKYVNGGLVTLLAWPMRGGQIDAYSHAIRLLRGNTEWVGFLDVDEFVVLHDSSPLSEFLSSIDADQVLLPWQNFPYCGHNARPGGSVIENYFWTYKVTETGVVQVKHFVKPNVVDRVTAHFSFLKNGVTKLADGQTHKPTHAVTGPTYRGAQLNHYATRSYAENLERFHKGQVSGSAHKVVEAYAPLSPQLISNLSYDDSILSALEAFKTESARWQCVADFPHRFGLQQSQPYLVPFNNFMFYLVKSYGNYLTNQSLVRPLSDYKFTQLRSGSALFDLGPLLADYHQSSIRFIVSTDSYLAFFQGTIHYGDFARRFGFDCIISQRQVNIAGSWRRTIQTGSGGVVAIVELEHDQDTKVSLVSGDGVQLATEVCPSGRNCVIVYAQEAKAPKGQPISLIISGHGNAREILYGRLP